MILSFYVAVLLIGTSTLFAIMADAMRRERVKEKARELGQVNEAEAEEEQEDDPVGEGERSILGFLDRCTRPAPFLRRLLKSVLGIALPDVPVTSELDPDEEAKKNRDK